MTSPAYSQRLDEAMRLAMEGFRHVYRKTTTIPYLTHLMWVSATVGEHGGDEDQMIAALLHDYLEDVEGSSAAALEQQFGPRVARMVVSLSDTVVRPKPPWRGRKEAHLAHLRVEPLEVKLISAADKLHNCRSIVRDHRAIGDAIFARFSVPQSETLWYFRAVVDALGERWAHPLLDELRDEVERLHGLSAIERTR
jgi:(p)ppGpp synthase/HD superfamily hydrolase